MPDLDKVSKKKIMEDITEWLQKGLGKNVIYRDGCVGDGGGGMEAEYRAGVIFYF